MLRTLPIVLFALWLAAPAPGGVIGEPKKAYVDRPDDVPRQHVVEVTDARHEYGIRFAGTVDGRMTRAPIGYAAFTQGWQPNRSVLIENLGPADVHNPRLIVNGSGDWRTLASIVAEATRGWTSESDKARAVWEFVRRQRFHACTWDGECSDAVKALNVYGYTLCGDQALVLNDLWNAAGLKTRRGYPVGHCVGEVLYDGRFHLLDSDEHVICLLRDNQTIASEADVVRDHDLMKRTHTYGIGSGESRQTDEFSASLYGYEGKREGAYGLHARHRMDLVLRPGESLEFRWDHVGKQYTAGTAPVAGQPLRDGLGDLLAGWGPTAYDNMRNGRLRYRPDLGAEVAQRGAESCENVTWDRSAARLRPSASNQPARVTWRFASPYVVVGGRASATVELPPGAAAQWRCSTDGKEWTTAAAVNAGPKTTLVATLDNLLSPRKRPTYGFLLQLQLQGPATAADVSFEHDIQTSALGLPELTVGENRIVYTDDSPGPRRVRVTHRWLERTVWHPPAAPAAAIAPADGAVVEGTRVRFVWNASSDPDGDAIVDYHFELSAHADMRWPLSPNFEKLTSLTPARGKPEWTVPYAGLLNPDTTYYWRVRALDATRVWGPWSRTFSFQCRAPGVPLELQLVPDKPAGLTLTWRANPLGRSPAAYKVYGSDEQGFSVSDTEHLVLRGKGFVRSFEEYAAKPANAPDSNMVKTPANPLARTSATRLRVVAPELREPNANKAFYRVVAVDSQGNESGPSDYVEVPRPYACNQPPAARVGVPFHYQPAVIRSIGDLRCRADKASSYNAAFWDREELTFQAVQVPEGLTLDPQTGLIQGKFTAAGEVSLAFKITTSTGRTATVTQTVRVAQ
jgi:hypothetical protein